MVMRALLIGGAFIIGIAILFFTVMGEGALKRHVTLSGVYSVCRPDGYDVVCFLDADGKEGGMFCLPLAQVGGECR